MGITTTPHAMNVSVICTIDGATRAQQIICDYPTRGEFQRAVVEAAALVEAAWFGKVAS